MAIFNGTLEARARLGLPDNPGIAYIKAGMFASGDLIEIPLTEEFYLGKLDQRNQVILSWLRGKFSNLRGHPIPVKIMRREIKKTKWVDQQLIWTLRRAWKCGQVRYFISGIYRQGISPQALEHYRDSLFETEEVYEHFLLTQAKEGNRGIFHGVHYMLTGRPDG